MKYIEEQLYLEKKKLETELNKVEKRLKKMPKGRICVRQKGNRVEYYYQQENETNTKTERNEKYMKKENIHIVKRIIQRDYDISLVKNIKKRIKIIEDFLMKYTETNVSIVYEKTTKNRRVLLEHAIISDEEYVKQWENVIYTGKNFPDNTTELYSNRGERVRSKSEKIIADRLQVLGIPYRYEYPLQLKNDITIYPDFTLLNIDTKEEIYLEHCGLMSEQSYVDNLIFKLKTYEKNGIYLGVNLFITYENNKHLFNAKLLDELVEKLFSSTKHNIV